MEQPAREKAREPELGHRRVQRYTAAFDRVQECVTAGYYLEAVALLDSLISDRLTSRITHLKSEEPTKVPTVGQAARMLVGGKNGPGLEVDTEIRSIAFELVAWAELRNDAMHATAKIFRTDDPKMSFDQVMRRHHDTALTGIRLLRQFDVADTRLRQANGVIPGTWPNAFFPEKRSRYRS